MSYRVLSPRKTSLKSVDIVEGETIEMKVRRITEDGEPIKDGAPELFTERKDDVVAGYNVRTDRFEVAIDAMDYVSKSTAAKREERAKMAVVKEEKIDGGAEPKQGGASVE